MTDEKKQHLEFLQTNISRMNTNSFQIKGLTITLVTATLAIFITNKNISLIILPIFSTLMFWFLDSYYLQQERKFRGVYNDVANINNQNTIKDYEIPLEKYTGNGYSFIEVMWSKTIVWIYFPIIITLISTTIIIVFF